MNDLDPKGLAAARSAHTLAVAKWTNHPEAPLDSMPDPMVDAIRAYLSAVPDGEGELVEALTKAILSVPDQIPCVVEVGPYEDITSGGTPFIAPGYKRNTTRRANKSDYLEAALAASRLPQAGVRVTDEMVERALGADLPGCQPNLVSGWLHFSEGHRKRLMRAALEAALSGDTL